MSTKILRPYQKTAIDAIEAAWAEGARNVCFVLPTGGGKTVIFSDIIARQSVPCAAIVHRSELVCQMSLALADNSLQHDIIASHATIRNIVAVHHARFGKSFYRAGARTFVASVDTLIKRPHDPRYLQVGLLIQDEAHHVLKDNKWGRAAELFPNARGLYPTATPSRADGKGLGRHADGLFDELIVGASMRDLINQGALCEYRIFAPLCDLDLSSVSIAASGDYSPIQLKTAVKKSHIVGDVVTHYIKHARGLRGITFAAGIESAQEIAQAYHAAGVTAELITGKTDDLVRAHTMSEFRAGRIMQLVNVDILGEGVDVPEVGVVSFARPTESYGLYVQQFGRALRPLAGKTHAIIIDHVGNVMRHGLPDRPRNWTLSRRDKRKSVAVAVTPIRVCDNPACNAVYPRQKKACPYCGQTVLYIARSAPELVDGDLTELDASVLMQLRGEIARIDAPARPPRHLDAAAQISVVKRHTARQDAQAALRGRIAQWAGCRKAEGLQDVEIQRKFFIDYGIDILTAQTLSVSEAEKLTNSIIFY